MTMQKDLYSVTEVAEMLGMHVKTVRNYVRDGRLKSTRIGKQYRIAKADLESFAGGAVSATHRVQAPRSMEVSSILQIDSIGPEDSNRLSNALVGAAKGSHEEQPLRVEAIYYPDKDRLKIIISGSIEATTALLKMAEFMATN